MKITSCPDLLIRRAYLDPGEITRVGASCNWLPDIKISRVLENLLLVSNRMIMLTETAGLDRLISAVACCRGSHWSWWCPNTKPRIEILMHAPTYWDNILRAEEIENIEQG